ncbi:hypothetical protein [Rhodococcus triatomae]|nr:hypothetical protein G419_03948 [Rhodococcus triatomae BKS 15-14]
MTTSTVGNVRSPNSIIPADNVVGGDDGAVPDIDVEPYLDAVVETAWGVLGTQFAGAYAAGSLARRSSGAYWSTR